MGLLCSLLVVLAALGSCGGQESSDDYLRNVVNELQLINGALPASSSEPDYAEQAYDERNARRQNYFQQSHEDSPSDFTHLQTVRLPESSSIDDPHLAAVASSSYPDYRLQHQLSSYKSSKCLTEPTPSTPMLLGFSPAELAAMYKKALTYGNPVKYGSLLGAINEQPPKIAPAHGDFDYPPSIDRYRQGESQYAYYFYPLQTFRHELNNHYGYKALPNSKYDAALAANNKAEAHPMNPILMGISSFLGMALFFVLSMFVYPRFLQYLHFPFAATSRAVLQNELAHLAVFVIEAIDYYNKSVQWRQHGSSAIHGR